VCGDLDFGEKSVNTKRRIPVNAKNKRCRRINSHIDDSIASNFSGEGTKNIMKCVLLGVDAYKACRKTSLVKIVI
jgi:hypothetical protein